jgi:hypothetical protein
MAFDPPAAVPYVRSSIVKPLPCDAMILMILIESVGRETPTKFPAFPVVDPPGMPLSEASNAFNVTFPRAGLSHTPARFTGLEKMISRKLPAASPRTAGDVASVIIWRGAITFAPEWAFPAMPPPSDSRATGVPGFDEFR